MKKLLLLAALSAGTLALTATPQEAEACSCMRPELSQQLKSSSIVFVGTAKDKKVGAREVTYGFAVSRMFKGEPVDQISVTTALHSASCGSNFEIGKSYVVYVSDQKDVHRTGLCSGNTYATDELIAKIEAEMANAGGPPVTDPVDPPVTQDPPQEPPAPVDPPPPAAYPPPSSPPPGNPACGGCTTSTGNGAAGSLLLLGMLAFVMRRRRE